VADALRNFMAAVREKHPAYYKTPVAPEALQQLGAEFGSQLFEKLQHAGDLSLLGRVGRVRPRSSTWAPPTSSPRRAGPPRPVGQGLWSRAKNGQFISVLERLTPMHLHRIYVVDDDRKPISIITLTDVLRIVVVARGRRRPSAAARRAPTKNHPPARTPLLHSPRARYKSLNICPSSHWPTHSIGLIASTSTSTFAAGRKEERRSTNLFTMRPTPTETALALSARGKGILASDESVPTIGKRLEKAGLVNDEATRRQYRDIFYRPRGGGDGDGGGDAGLGAAGISGAILFKEALDQSCCCSTPNLTFVEGLKRQGVLVGVKVDAGLEPLQSAGALAGETQTRGLDALPALVQEVAARGATFAKFRCALRMASDGASSSSSGPSEGAIDVNARQLAEYAAICQAGGGDANSALLPIVEPELLIDGAHDAAAFELASARVISATVAALWRQPGIALDGLLLKPQMICPGSEWRPSSSSPSSAAGGLPISPEEVAARTLRVMRSTVPPAIPGIMFLSGGQTERQATENLDALNRLATEGGRASSAAAPWALSFSFGRGLQASVLKTWADAGGGNPGASEEEREAAARAARVVAVGLAEANGLAAKGEWRASGKAHPSVLSGVGLHETFRGHY
jgi:fructose-bisphosphate aldolase class I